MPPSRRTSPPIQTWQRRVLVTLGTLVVIMAALAVGLIIRNALGSFGLTDQPVTSQPPSSDGGTANPDPSTDTGPAGTQAPTTPATNPPTPATDASTPSLPPPPATFVEEDIRASDLRLQPEGLGPIPFGTQFDRTLLVLTRALGLPDADSGWLPAEVEELQCPGTRARRVTWGSLNVFFSDGPTDWGPNLSEHFFSFLYSLPEGATSPAGPSLRTSEGLQLGDTLSRSSSIYGESSISRDDPARGTILEVNVPGPGYLQGTFTGPSEGDYLRSLQGGTGCRG